MSKSLVSSVMVSLKWGVSLKIISQVLSWTVTIYVIRLLNPDDYTMMSLVDMSLSTLLVIGTLGTGPAIIKSQKIENVTIKSLLTVLVLINVFFLLSIFLLRHEIAIFFDYPDLDNVLMVASLSFLFNPYITISEALLARDMRFKEMEKIKFTSMILVLIANVVFATLGFGYWSLILGNIIGRLSKIFLYVLLRGELLSFSFQFGSIRSLVADSSYNFIAGVVWEINERVDRFFISKMMESRLLGVYSMSYSLTQKPVNLTGTFIQMIGLASFSKIKHDVQKVGHYIVRSTEVLAILMIPIFFGLASVAPDLVPLLLGDQWSDAVVVIQILAIVQIVNLLKLNIGSALFSMHYAKRKIYHSIVALFILIASWLLGLNFGFIEGCFSYLTGYSLWFIWHVIDSKDRLGLNLANYWRSIVIPLAMSLAMFILVRAVDGMFSDEIHVLLQLIIEIVLGAISYLLLALLFYKEKTMFIKGLLLK